MNKIRKDCFWYNEGHDMNARIDSCGLQDLWSCPCTEDCKWFIKTKNVERMAAQLVGAKEEYERMHR